MAPAGSPIVIALFDNQICERDGGAGGSCVRSKAKNHRVKQSKKPSIMHRQSDLTPEFLLTLASHFATALFRRTCESGSLRGL